MTIEETIKALVEDAVSKAFAKFQPKPKDAWLNVNEAADLASVSYNTIKRWMAKGLIYNRIGKTIRIRESDLNAFIAGSKKTVAQRAIETYKS